MNTKLPLPPDQADKIRLIIFPWSATYANKKVGCITTESYGGDLNHVPANFRERVNALPGDCVEVSVNRDFNWAALMADLEMSDGKDMTEEEI